MKSPIVAANWKMNLTIEEGLELVKQVLDDSSSDDSEIIFFPPYIALSAISGELKNTEYKVGIQNIHHEKSGAYTGEISAEMVKFLDVQYAIIGHSERRLYFNETDSDVNNKLNRLLDNEIIPVLCFGESLEQRSEGSYLEYVKTQINEGLKGVRKDKVNKLVLAYEPIWAIGSGKLPSSEEINAIHFYIKDIVQSIAEIEAISVIYGGSVNCENAKSFFQQTNIDGA